MDLADDIAYSTYDLEDAMIAGVVTPFDVIACKDVYLEQICLHLNKKLGELNYAARIDQKDILAILMRVFSNILSYADDTDYAENTIFQRIAFVARSYRENLLHTHSQAIRRRFMETLIEGAVRSITVDVNEEVPMLSMAIGKRLEIECLKAFTFEVVTSSQNNQIAAHRSAKIVKKLWEELSQDDKGSLLPDDVRPLFRKAEGREADCIVRDLIATLTDKEAIELYKKVSA
jgi:dGTPase